MNPILFDLGVIRIYWYSLFIFLGILIGGIIIYLECKKYGMPDEFIINLFFWTIPIAVLGARIYYVIFNWSLYSGNILSIFRIWEGGLAIHGGMIAALIFIFIYTYQYGISTSFILDVIVPGLIIGQAIGRWGNFFNGEAHGAAVTYEYLKRLLIPDFIIDGMMIGGTYYQPTFLYESLWCFLGFIVLMVVRKFPYTKVGQITGSYLIWYGIGRFFIEGMRTDSLMIGPLRMAQVVSVIMVIVGIVLVIIKGRGSKFENQYSKYEVGEILM